MTTASPFELAQIESAQTALDSNHRIVALDDERDPGTDLFHMLGSMLTWADAWGVDFDDILSQVREPYNLSPTVSRFKPDTYGLNGAPALIPGEIDFAGVDDVGALLDSVYGPLDDAHDPAGMAEG